MKKIQEHLRHLLQTIPTSKMLQLHRYIDARFVILNQVQIKHVKDVGQNVTLYRPNSLNKAMDDLFTSPLTSVFVEKYEQ